MDKRFEYMDMTHKLNDYNEIYNVNKHIDKSTDEEMGRLLAIHNSLKIKILKLKQQ